jgi:hypothetical protein
MGNTIYDLTECTKDTTSSKGNLKKLVLDIGGTNHYIKSGREWYLAILEFIARCLKNRRSSDQ